MDDDLGRGQKYREQGQALRTMAEQESDDFRKTSLLDLAIQYERISEKLLKRALDK